MQAAALAAADPRAAVHRHVRLQGERLDVSGKSYDLGAVDGIWVVGAGKAAPAMAKALQDLLRDRLSGGILIVPYGQGSINLGLAPVEVVEAGHPIPDEAGAAGSERLAGLLASSGERDLVLAVLSGGASALTTLPAPGLALPDLQLTTDLLLRSGATIAELNCVRKHLARLKGGDLVRQAASAQVVGLILSDVVGDSVDVIASGPTAPDSTSFADTWAIFERYALVQDLPAAVRERVKAGMLGDVPDTPKPGNPLFQRVQNVIVGSNGRAAEAAVEAARQQGMNALLLSTFVEGEARQVGRVAAALAREIACHDRPVSRPACLIWGGETTVTVRGLGRGGRNQELALAAALAMQGLPGLMLVALATDGIDGPTDAAGAVATGETVERARALGFDASECLYANDSYPFFAVLDDLIRTGPTGTNVSDLMFLFAFAEGGKQDGQDSAG